MPRKKEETSIAEEILASEPTPEPAEPKKRGGGRKYKPRYRTQETVGQVNDQPVKKGSKTRSELQKLSTDGDLVDIWERRILNPNHQESRPIRITTPGMVIRWINLSHRGRFQRARYEQGWVPVTKAELIDEREIFGVSYTSEGYVCRGEKQTEMLMKMPQAVYRKIQQRRSEENLASYKKLRTAMGSAGHAHFKERYGGSAGDVAEEAASQFVGQIKFGTEKASTTELFE